MAGHATVGAAERRHPDLLHADGNGLRLLSTELLGHLASELRLVVAPLVLAIVASEEDRRHHEEHADDCEEGPVDAGVGGIGPLFHQILVGISGQVSHGQ